MPMGPQVLRALFGVIILLSFPGIPRRTRARRSD